MVCHSPYVSLAHLPTLHLKTHIAFLLLIWGGHSVNNYTFLFFSSNPDTEIKALRHNIYHLKAHRKGRTNNSVQGNRDSKVIQRMDNS